MADALGASGAEPSMPSPREAVSGAAAETRRALGAQVEWTTPAPSATGSWDEASPRSVQPHPIFDAIAAAGNHAPIRNCCKPEKLVTSHALLIRKRLPRHPVLPLCIPASRHQLRCANFVRHSASLDQQRSPHSTASFRFSIVNNIPIRLTRAWKPSSASHNPGRAGKK